jgi:uroporphyrinogen-III synthase
VGDATAERARARGFTRVESAAGDAEALHALVRESCQPQAGPLLLASGAGQGLKLATLLRQDGFRVLRRVAYAARKVAALPEDACLALAANRIKAVLFFSTETARVFARILPPSLHPSLRAADAVVIAPGVADAVQHLPWHAVRVALHPTQDEMLSLLP